MGYTSHNVNILLLSIMAITVISTASAHPEILDGFNRNYDTFKTRLDTCDLCHTPGKPPTGDTCETCKTSGKPEKDIDLNPYGMAIKSNMNKEMNQAFKEAESNDSDKDKFTNIDEIQNLTLPGDKKDFPKGKKSFKLLDIFPIPNLHDYWRLE